MPVPIVTYHSVGESVSSLSTPTSVFEAHLAGFTASGYRTVTMAEVVRWVSRGQHPPTNALVITFDDGYESVYREAWPRLKACNFIASVFLVSDHCGTTSRWPSQPASVHASPLLGWPEAAALAGEGWEMGAHSRTHPPLTVLTPAAIEEEVAGSQRTIRERTGQSVEVFAYPYGAVNGRVKELVRRYFAGAVTTDLGLVARPCDPHLLPRIDAHYLRPEHIPNLRGAAYRRYLSARQAGRWLRRRFRQDWDKGFESVCDAV